MSGFSFDERTAKRLIREAKRSMRAPRTKRKRERRYRPVGGGGGTSSVNAGLAYIVEEVSGKTEAAGTVTFGVGKAVPVVLDATLGTATYDTSNDWETTTSEPFLNPSAEATYEYTIYNFCGAPVPVGKIIHWTAHGATYSELGGPMKFIDAEDCS
jgi:hypothetical protein